MDTYLYENNLNFLICFSFFFWVLSISLCSTGCPVFTEIFQEALIGTYIPQYLMTNDSFSSQTWAISVPNRNSDVKSISWPTGPPRVRSQNKGYWQYLSKIKGKLFGIFTKFWSNLWAYGIKIVFIQLLCFKGFQNCPWWGFNHTWKPSNLNWRNKFELK